MIKWGAIAAIGVVVIVLVLIFTGACLQGSSNGDVIPPGPTRAVSAHVTPPVQLAAAHPRFTLRSLQ
jgi:hypothetical protein